MPINETEQYILDSVKVWVWSGFYSEDEVDKMIDDILEEDANEQLVRSAVAAEFEAKSAAEKLWPERTDCDRLDVAFETIDELGIIALQNAGYTMSDGHDDVSEVLRERGTHNINGYCFYHGQDLERAVAGQSLMIAFGDLDENKSRALEVGKTVKNVLEDNGFTVGWDENPERRIEITNLSWQRRLSA